MFFHQKPDTPINQVRIFLQLTDDFENKNNKILQSKLLTKEKAIEEATILFEKLKQIQSQHAIKVKEAYLPALDEVTFLEEEITTLQGELTKNFQANPDNYRITIEAKRQELNKLLKAHIVIDISQIKNLDKLVFVSNYPAQEEDARAHQKR